MVGVVPNADRGWRIIVMPANNTKSYALAEQYPGHVGMLFSPNGWQNPKGLPFALDNGRFAVWSRGKTWHAKDFLKLLDRQGDDPLWVVVPDVVGDACETFTWWEKWEPRLREYGWPLALAVQDGMTPRSVHRHSNPDVIFIGGTTKWKRSTVWQWCQTFERVHIGRVNTAKWLWNAARCGAESCDGTGWFRGDQKQLKGLHHFLKLHSQGLRHAQLELEFARTFGGNVPLKSHLTGGGG